MKPEIESAIKLLAGKITESVEPYSALQYTQAALNLANVEATLVGVLQAESNIRYLNNQ